MQMYNPLTKIAYIDYYMSKSQAVDVGLQYRRLENFFSRLGKIEKAFDVDIADADYETAILILSQMGKGGARSDANILTICKQYIDWSINNGYTEKFENQLDGVTIKDLDKSAMYRMTMVKDEQELIDYFRIGLVDIHGESVDMVFLTYSLLIFNGVEPKLVLKLLSNSVDLLKKTVCVDGVMINLSDAVCAHITALNDIDTYIVPRGELSPRTMPKANTGHLLETSSSNRRNLEPYLRGVLSRTSNKYYNMTHIRKSITSIGIYKSGVFYRAWLKECAGGDVSLDEFFQFKSAQAIIVKNKLLIEYKNWKKAFRL